MQRFEPRNRKILLTFPLKPDIILKVGPFQASRYAVTTRRGFMYQASEAIERFFRTFEANASSQNVEAQVSQFADVFMAASPHGTQAVRAADFALALPKKKQLFDRMGCR